MIKLTLIKVPDGRTELYDSEGALDNKGVLFEFVMAKSYQLLSTSPFINNKPICKISLNCSTYKVQ